MWHVLLTLLLIESQVTWTVASSVDLPLEGHSYSGQDDLEEGSYSRTAHQDDQNGQTQKRHENTNVKDKWQESRERINKLQELQDKFADVQMTLMAQLGTIKRHLSWKTPSLPASQCKDDHGDRSDEGTSWAADNFGAGTLNCGRSLVRETRRRS
ncbi:uncharacterized protein [Apostichopus japonicus]|uniref:uncharacterized protein isoform X2 n=1 Tax=Stichopus japonicus TaxID=307972 RepID=UPI003AB7ABC3